MNKSKQKEINQFVVVCVEMYARHINKTTTCTYLLLKRNGITKMLFDGYEFMHGFGFEYINDYIDKYLKSREEVLDYTLGRALLSSMVIELIAEDKQISFQDASDIYYNSNLPGLLADDRTGLYGDSPQYIYSLIN